MSYFYANFKTSDINAFNGIDLYGGTNNAYNIRLQPNTTLSTNYTMLLPDNLSNNGDALTVVNNSTGELGFTTISTGISNVTANLITEANTQANIVTTSGNVYISSNNDYLVLNSGSNIELLISSNKLIELSSNKLQIDIPINLSNVLTVGANTDVTGNINLTKSLYVTENGDITGSLTVGANTDITGNINLTKSLLFSENGNTVTINVRPTLGPSYRLNLPESLGTVNQVLKIVDINGSTANIGFDVGGISNVYLSNILAGDAESTLTTSVGNITIDASNGNIFIVSNVNSKIINTVGTTNVLEMYSGGSNLSGTITTTGNLVVDNTFNLTQYTITGNTSSNLSLDLAESSDFLINLETGISLNLIKPTNINRIGQQGSIFVKIPSGATHSLTWQTSNGWFFSGGIAPSISTTANAYDVFSYVVLDNTSSQEKILIMDANNFQEY